MKFHRGGGRQFGDKESDTTVLVWVWMESHNMWIPKSPSRHFPTGESLVEFAEGLGTVAFIAESGGPVPQERPEGSFEHDLRIGKPWADTPAPGDFCQDWVKRC